MPVKTPRWRQEDKCPCRWRLSTSSPVAPQNNAVGASRTKCRMPAAFLTLALPSNWNASCSSSCLPQRPRACKSRRAESHAPFGVT
eukprot:353402-Chlamydomonas_euryale.AAC.1